MCLGFYVGTAVVRWNRRGHETRFRQRIVQSGYSANRRGRGRCGRARCHRPRWRRSRAVTSARQRAPAIHAGCARGRASHEPEAAFRALAERLERRRRSLGEAASASLEPHPTHGRDDEGRRLHRGRASRTGSLPRAPPVTASAPAPFRVLDAENGARSRPRSRLRTCPRRRFCRVGQASTPRRRSSHKEEPTEMNER